MINRRKFISTSVFATAAVATPSTIVASEKNNQKPFEGIGDAEFTVGEPCLQAPGETTIGVSWCVSGLSKGVVEVATNPEMKDSRIVKSGGFGLVPIDISTINVRLENLKPSTKYYYRTITTPFTDYKNIYDAKLGKEVVSKVYSFTTLGAEASAHFAVMNDTHAQWKSFALVAKKLKEIKPTVVMWNGDATNTTQDKETAVEIFLNPPIKDKDYATTLPTCFVSGNHDFRGSWISKKEEVMMPRHPAERTGSEWDLKWNFAVRLGDIAMIGMDTGEDKPDAHPKWFGLANFEPYRIAQTAWLEKALSRPDIASAKYKVLFCHIPLFAAKNTPDYPHDGVKIDPRDFAYWSRECFNLWNPILIRNKVQLVVAAHAHEYRFDPATTERPWAQIVGGGCNIPARRPTCSPTVIEGRVIDGVLKLTVHNIETGKILNEHMIEALA